jgi:hypothetical protein
MRGDFDAQTLLARVGAAGALLICFSIVLGAGHFGSTGKREAMVATTAPTPPAVSAAAASAEMATPARLEPVVEAVHDAAPAPSSPTLASITDSRADATPIAATHIAMEGVWAPGTTCTRHSFRDGALPTVINADGAWAGDTFCIFKNKKQTDTTWSLTAECSSGREQWTTRVRVTIAGDRLIWASKRGTQAYARCAPDMLIAEAR